jgi:hypothetical protein
MLPALPQAPLNKMQLRLEDCCQAASHVQQQRWWRQLPLHTINNNSGSSSGSRMMKGCFSREGNPR